MPRATRTSASPRGGSYDVVVVGGGAAGIGAATGAALSGARTLLVERYGFLGGTATISQVATYCGFYTRGSTPTRAVAGVGAMLLEELERMKVAAAPFHVPTTGNWVLPLDPEATKIAAERTVMGSGAEVLLHARLINATVANGRLSSVTLFDHEGPFEVEGHAFIDASGDGNLAHLAGGPVRSGDGQGRYQVATLPLRIGGVPTDVEVDTAELARAAEKANADQGGSDPLDTAPPLAIRLPRSGDLLMLIADQELGGISSEDLTAAEIAARQVCWRYAEAYRRFVRGFEDSFVATSGPQIGVREGRHLVGNETVLGRDLVSGQRRDDGIARAAWPIELHPAAGVSTSEYLADGGWADIPYGALVNNEVPNLWCAGRTISCDAEAFGSVRVMGTSFATGHAAGVGAATWLEHERHDIPLVRSRLVEQGALV